MRQKWLVAKESIGYTTVVMRMFSRRILSQLCLFNLYKQRLKEIERFCDVSVSEVASHAVQLSGNQFQILASRPTQLTIACKEGAEVQTI